MTNPNFNYFKPGVLIALIIALAWGVYLVKHYTGFSIALLSIITFILTFWALFLWNIKPFSYAFWIDDFSGTYEGTLKYWEVAADGTRQCTELPHVKIITQNGYKVSVHSFTYKSDGTNSSPSKNLGMYIKKTSDGNHYEMIYSFQNDGSLEQGFAPYIGTEQLKFRRGDDNTKLLSGIYFTNRLPQQTRGEVNLKWVSKETNHPF